MFEPAEQNAKTTWPPSTRFKQKRPSMIALSQHNCAWCGYDKCQARGIVNLSADPDLVHVDIFCPSCKKHDGVSVWQSNLLAAVLELNRVGG
jgi:hypothetical protein